MKKTELRKIIREEVIGVLHDVLPSLLAEVVAESQVPSVEQLQENRQTFEQTRTPKKQSMAEMIGLTNEYEDTNEPIQYSSNPILNEILNQTKGGVPQAQTPAMAMAMAAEEASMAELMNESADVSFATARPDFGNDFDSKLNRTIPNAVSPQPQNTQPQQESFNPNSSTVAEIGDVPMDFIANLTKNAKATLDASKTKGPSGGISNINFES